MSASAPLGRPSRNTGSVDAVCTSATISADGVNVDVELIKGTWFAAYGAFVANLRAALQADNPAASVSGLYFGNPQSIYFDVDNVGRDQVEDYAKRKGWTVEKAEKWLRPVLGYKT